MELSKYSLGMGDRFAHQAVAQLRACQLAAEAGVEVTPVWNKSNREHSIIGSEPSGTRAAADAAVKALGWSKPYFLDADHINLETFKRFLTPCDFFTIDVADNIGQKSDPDQIANFLATHPELQCTLSIPGIDQPFHLDRAFVEQVATKLPTSSSVDGWSSQQFVSALRHDRDDPAYNPSVRQLLDVGFKVAAKLGSRYTDALETNRTTISRNVTDNLFERHLKPLFLPS